MSVPIYEALAAFLFLFVVPGFSISRAVFPEWRFRGPGGTERVIETAAFSLVVSVSLTVLLGFGLENTPSVGFQASWSDPLLELLLAVVSIIALVVAVLRGGFSRVIPSVPIRESPSGPAGSWESLRALDQIARQERRLEHAFRRCARGSPESVRLSEELEQLKARRTALREQREVEFAS